MKLSHNFTSEQFEEVENIVNEMADKLVELREKLIEIGIPQNEIREIRFLNELNTALSSDVEGLKEYVVDKYNLQTFRDWKNKQEIFENETIELNLEFENGEKATAKAEINFATRMVCCSDENFSREDLISAKFSQNRFEYTVCLECGEGMVDNGKCSNCG